MQQKVEPIEQMKANTAAWQARVDLAAAHRLAVMFEFHEGIFNHLTLRVPGTTDRYYQIPFGMHWSEVTASSFMEVAYDGTLLKGEGEVERSCYCIHAPIHKRVARAAAVFHTHMPYTSALSRLEDPRIKPIGQTEALLMKSIAYDADYQGPAYDPDEGGRLAELFGDKGDKTILFMANHGVATIGSTVAEAFDKLYYIERAAQVQLYAMWTGKPLKFMDPAVTERTMAATGQSFKMGKPCEYHFAALKRILDRKEPDYRD
jgi:ribulose-5-phosphate 4-epimerase/fuculose-1-phosphate aldolase